MKLKISEKYVSLSEAAKICGMRPNSLRVYAEKGKLDAVKFGRNWVTTEKALNSYLKKRNIKKLPKRYKRKFNQFLKQRPRKRKETKRHAK